MGLYDVVTNAPSLATDVQQLVDIFKGKHDVSQVDFALATAPPTASNFSLAVANGTALGIGSYTYVFTYISGYYRSDGTFYKSGETLVSSTLSITTTSGSQAVNITFPTTGIPNFIYQFGVYRTTVGGNTYKLVNTIKVGTGVWTDTVSDGSLGAAPPTINTTGTKFYFDSYTAPNQPIFSCTPPNTFTSLAANVETTVPYTGTFFDNTGLFTAPVAGRWLFCPQLYGNVANGTVSMNYYHNGTNTYMLARYTNPSTTTCEFVFGPSIVVSCASGDTVKFTATSTVANNMGWQNCVVSVMKIA